MFRFNGAVNASVLQSFSQPVENFISTVGRSATCAYVFRPSFPSSTVYLAVGDSGGGISFSSLDSCSSAFVFENSLTFQLSGSSSVNGVRVNDATSEVNFLSDSTIMTFKWVQAVSGLVPGIVKTTPTSDPGYRGWAVDANGNGVTLSEPSTDGKGNQLFKSETGAQIASFTSMSPQNFEVSPFFSPL